MIHRTDIRRKFGDQYTADLRTFTMGIDQRFTAHFAERVRGKTVLETCTGGGFSTIALARSARQVHTVEIDPLIQAQARQNVGRAGLLDRVSFIAGDVMDTQLLRRLPPVDAAFLDPDWAVSGPGHRYRFCPSNTEPPADRLLETVFGITSNVALVLPPLVDTRELKGLPAHEFERLFLDGSRELFCLYFGDLAAATGETEFHVTAGGD
jgi:hypothetical protein